MNKQASAVLIFLLIIILIMLTVLITLMFTSPVFYSSLGYKTYDGNYNVDYRKSDIYTKDIELICTSPYVKINEMCCIDSNINQICDHLEVFYDSRYDSRYDNRYQSDYRYEYYDDGYDVYHIDRRNRDYDTDADISSPFHIVDHDIDNDEIMIRIRNRASYSVIVKKVEIEDCDKLFPDVELEEDESYRFNFDCDKDNRFDRDLEVEYIKEGESFTRTARGNVERDYDNRFRYF